MNTQNLNVTQHLATKVCATTVLRPELSSWTTGLSLIKRVVNNYKKLTNYARWKCNKRVWVRIWIEAWFSNMTDRMFRILRASKLNQRADSYRSKDYKKFMHQGLFSTQNQIEDITEWACLNLYFGSKTLNTTLLTIVFWKDQYERLKMMCF